MSAESIKTASAVYFTLLKDKVIDENSEHFQAYFDPDVRQTVLLMADESGTFIIESPKRIQLVYPKQGKEANTLLIEGIKGGQPDLKILPPLFVYDQNNEYTDEVKEILYGKH